MRKARSNPSLSQGVLRQPTFNNLGLFAKHYLDNRLPEIPEWQNPDGIEEAFRAILEIYNQKSASLTNANEAQTESDFVRPVLGVLWGEQQTSDCYQVQVSIPAVVGRRQPDYAFFRCAADREAADTKRGTIEYWRDAPCLGDAKAWPASLDKQRGVDENPSTQIAGYLWKSGVRWGILTNGRLWRLYEREKSSPGGVYFEVNLEDILRENDADRFKWFYLFFRRQAFRPGADGKTFIEEVFQGSVNYATGVGDKLKESVYDALRLLINGFFERAENKLNPRNTDHVTLVHGNSLILLYRLLFLFYAEDKGLLPRGDRIYRDYSMERLQKLVNRELREGREYLAGEHRFWPQLTTLFESIDSGLGRGEKTIIPAYNGGLFSADKHPHIAHTPQPGVTRWEIGDDRLAQVIDMLAYERERWDEPGDKDIDYRTLEVQHLGSIYEGLLDLQPQVADEELVEVSESGKLTFRPTRAISDSRPFRGHARRIAVGEAYLVTDRGERKATGSYYTPRYIVDYIVQNTVGELAEEAAAEVAELRPKVDKIIAKLREQRRQWEAKPDGYDAAQLAQEIVKIDGEIENERRRLLEPYLSLSILDPAMGSGHFLVGAADLLSLDMATNPNILPLENIGAEDPQAYYKRLVVERCLYGVDLNPLAVELAKLSLWLHTASKGKALSFLDHHLRAGNSLIGASIEDDLSKEPPLFNGNGKRVNAENPQLVLGFAQALQGEHLSSLLALLHCISEVPTHDKKGEKLKEQLYQELESKRAKFRAVANCWLAPFFGCPVTAADYEKAVNALRESDVSWREVEDTQWFVDAQTVADSKRFFHWELEFPEVFFNTRGLKDEAERGFDAVIGNPPFVDSEEMARSLSDVRQYCTARWEAAKGNWDLFVVFLQIGLTLSRAGCFASMIVPNKLLGAEYCASIQALIRRRTLRACRDYSTVPVFPDANVYPIVLCIQNLPAGAGHTIRVSVMDQPDTSPVVVREFEPAQAILEVLPEGVWQPLLSGNIAIVSKCLQGARRLDAVCDVSDAATVAEAYKLKSVLAPLSEAGDRQPSFRFVNTGVIDRYKDLWATEPVQYIGSSYVRPVVDAGKLAAMLPTRFEQAKSPKLVIAGLTKVLEATYDGTGNSLPGKSTVVVRNSLVDQRLLLALLNSRLFTFLYRELYGALALQGGYLQVGPKQLGKLPIFADDPTRPPADDSASLQKLTSLYDACSPSSDIDSTLGVPLWNCSPGSECARLAACLIAYLAQRMVNMHQESQEEIGGFLTWLQSEIGANVNDLTNKTKIRDYHEHDFETLLDVLRKNAKKLKANPDARKFQEDLRREVDASVGKLSPLKERIAATDRLIDQIVYKLYGLTEDEIRIVEGD
ncbi:MAG: TaqI-like C-terminal specificity domain-containing protein [Armatimonadota bacterium]|nr:TaqI-like C-terminal specificity domain-containing protein [Armatimonadota bacterium]